MPSAPTIDVLQPGMVRKVVSRLKQHNTFFERFFAPGGTDYQAGRNFAVDIFDDTRDVAKMRAPGTGPNTIAAHPVGVVSGKFPRSHEKLPLPYEKISNYRKIGGQMSDLDERGERYIEKQWGILRQRQANFRAAQWALALRGGFDYSVTGDDMDLKVASGTPLINFQIPAGNKAKLDALGDGDIIAASWATAGTDIPAHIQSVDEASQQLTGQPIKHIIMNTKTYAATIPKNTQVKEQAGSSNIYFDQFRMVDETRHRQFELRGLPGYTFHVVNEFYKLRAGTIKAIPDNYALFLPEPSPDWVATLECDEVVVEWDGGPKAIQVGEYMWANEISEPAAHQLYSVYNGISAIYVPKCVFFGLVVY